MRSEGPSTSRQAKREAQHGLGGWRRILVPLLLVAGAAGVVGLVALMPPAVPPAAPSEVPPVNVTVQAVVAAAALADTLDLTGVVEANRVVRVAAELSGRVERYGQRPREIAWRGRAFRAGATIAEGDPVSEGDPLVGLNSDLQAARYAQAQAQFEYDLREYQRILDLFEQQVTSKTELDNARTRRDIAQAQLDEVSEQLKRTSIVAPISGILNRLPAEIGEYVASGDAVAEIVDVDRVKLVVDVPERDVHYLGVGDQVRIFARTIEPAELTGAITYISELADELTRTTRVEITIDNRSQVLRSGQIVQVRLTRRTLHDVIMIPLSAVIPLERGRVVYIVDEEGLAQRRTVELGFLKGRQVRVRSGLTPGDRLIVAGHRYVAPDQPVTIITEDVAAATNTDLPEEQ
ncbi:MAG: efflux RND transporter periplasmic adaptor subunit [Planctomycetes bacterium]|nr:efflux RND transporter periplasmic adaptor subunit [Planctomycetota bacterium]